MEIWNDEPIIIAIRKAFDAQGGNFSESDLVEVDRVLTACLMAIDDYYTSRREIRELLTGLQNGYSCWLSWISEAIWKAEIEEDTRHLMYGAFMMAKAYLFDIEGHMK
jgi:hypothetical protein